MNRFRPSWILLPAGLLLSGCASTRGSGIEQVTSVVEDRAGVRLQKQREAESEIKTKTYALLKEELTEESALQIALLNNRSLQATLKELGVAKADLVEAGLLQNPELEGGIGYVKDHPGKSFPHFTLTQNVMDFFLVPLRRRAASAQFEEAKLRVSNAVLELVAKVKSTFYELQAAEQVRAMMKSVVETAEAATELAKRQYEAGNLNELNLAFQQSLFQEARVDLARRETELSLARDALGETLGILALGADLKAQSSLRDLPESEIPLENLETLALSQRLDLAAMRQRVTSLERSLTLAKWTVAPDLSLGYETETEPEEGRTVRRSGPEIKLGIPLFNRGQSGRLRARTQLQKAQDELAALENQARREVRAARARLLEARKVTEYYRDSLIPIRGKIVEQTQRHYNFMLLGVYQLLEAKREEIHARREHIEALRNYWIERSNLELAVSGKFDVAGKAPAKEPQPSQPAETPPDHHEHHKDGGQQ